MFGSLLYVLIGLCSLTQQVTSFSLRTVKQIFNFCLGFPTIIHASHGSVVVINGVVYPPKKITGSGTLQRKELACNDISEVICNYGKVDIVRGIEDKLVIVADDNILNDYVLTKIQQRTIDLGLQSKPGENNNFENVTLKFYLTLKNLSAVKSSGALTEVKAADFTASDFQVEAHSSSVIQLIKIITDHCSLNAAGTSVINFDGDAKRLDVVSRSDSKVDMQHNNVEECDIKCSGTSKCFINNNNDTIKRLKACAKSDSTINIKNAIGVSTYSNQTGNNDSVCDIESHGTSAVHIERFKIDLVKAYATGVSTIELLGVAKNLDIRANSSSKIIAHACKTDFCKIDASSSSTCKLWVIDQLQATAASSSSIRCKGKPRQVFVKKRSSAEISYDL